MFLAIAPLMQSAQKKRSQFPVIHPRKFLSMICWSKKNAASTLRKQDSRSSAIVSKEEKAEGSVSFMAYDYYIKSGGYIWFFLLILVTAGAKGFDVGSQFYLALWNSKSTNAEEKNEPLSSSENLAYLNFYAMLLMLGVASFVIRSLAGAVHRLQAASIIHKDILDNILKVPISFFDITPIGRILNRFSSDMATVDFEIGPTVIQYLNCMISVLGSVTAIAVSTKGALLILMLPLMLLFYTWKNYFLKSNTELKRLINISRSPIYADFSTALSGIATIRAFGDEPRFIRGMEEKVNINTRPSMLSYSAVQWLSIRLDCNGALVSFFIAAVTAATIKYDFIPPGYLGLALSISFEMTLYLRQAVNMAAQFEVRFCNMML
jgi:ATP-binding cassette, subfamily C (CFTR/MRP), member 1